MVLSDVIIETSSENCETSNSKFRNLFQKKRKLYSKMTQQTEQFELNFILLEEKICKLHFAFRQSRNKGK